MATYKIQIQEIVNIVWFSTVGFIQSKSQKVSNIWPKSVANYQILISSFIATYSFGPYLGLI